MQYCRLTSSISCSSLKTGINVTCTIEYKKYTLYLPEYKLHFLCKIFHSKVGGATCTLEIPNFLTISRTSGCICEHFTNYSNLNHSEYGLSLPLYTASFKLGVVEFAEKYETERQRKSLVNDKVVSYWRKKKEVLQSMPKM